MLALSMSVPARAAQSRDLRSRPTGSLPAPISGTQPGALGVLITPIRRYGRQDMWTSLAKMILEHQVGDVKGCVVVQRGDEVK